MGRAPSASSGSTRTFDRHVRQVVRMLVTGGAPDVGIVARAVRTSPRTLQRRLQEAGLTFAEVLQQARCVAAEQMLRDPGRKIGDVARVLGYSDPAHFTRAFVRWTGITPRDFRRRRQNDTAQRRQPRTLSVR